FFFQAEDGIRDRNVTGVQTCALPISIIEAYQIGAAPGVRIDAADITHMAYTNPNSLLYGQSPLMAVGKAVDVDNSAAAWQKISKIGRASCREGVEMTVGTDAIEEERE